MTGFHPPRRHHRARMMLRLWWHRQQAPIPAECGRLVATVRPALALDGAAILAWMALCAACIAAVATGYPVGFGVLAGLGIAGEWWARVR
jgi:hypothetical protein